MTDNLIQQPAEAAISTETTVVSEPQVASDWKSGLADEFKESKALQNFKDINDLVKSHLHLNSLLGKKVTDYSKEDIEGFMGKLGKPESPDKYVAPEELDQINKDLKIFAHKAGLTQEQFKKLADEIIITNRETSKAEAERLQIIESQWADEIRKEFGFAINERMAIADRAVKALGGESLLGLLQDTGLNKHPALVKLFAKIGTDFLEADKVVEADKVSTFGITPQDAKRMIDQKLSDKEFSKAYYSNIHPNHAAAVAEMNELFSKLS